MDSSGRLSPGVHLLNASTPLRKSILESVADIHASCILRDHTMASFLPPLSRPEMIEHWRKLYNEVQDVHLNESRLILVHISEVSNRSTTEIIDPPFKGQDWLRLPSSIDNPDDMQATLEVSGVVSLSMPESQTGPFRGLVQKLFISPYHRRKGVARQLMVELEHLAKDRGRWSLMLDTTIGTPAEHLYPKLGYNLLGVVKDYGFSPRDQALVDEIFFWKDLRAS